MLTCPTRQGVKEDCLPPAGLRSPFPIPRIVADEDCISLPSPSYSSPRLARSSAGIFTSCLAAPGLSPPSGPAAAATAARSCVVSVFRGVGPPDAPGLGPRQARPHRRAARPRRLCLGHVSCCAAFVRPRCAFLACHSVLLIRTFLTIIQVAADATIPSNTPSHQAHPAPARQRPAVGRIEPTTEGSCRPL